MCSRPTRSVSGTDNPAQTDSPRTYSTSPRAFGDTPSSWRPAPCRDAAIRRTKGTAVTSDQPAKTVTLLATGGSGTYRWSGWAPTSWRRSSSCSAAGRERYAAGARAPRGRATSRPRRCWTYELGRAGSRRAPRAVRWVRPARRAASRPATVSLEAGLNLTGWPGARIAGRPGSTAPSTVGGCTAVVDRTAGADDDTDIDRRTSRRQGAPGEYCPAQRSAPRQTGEGVSQSRRG